MTRNTYYSGAHWHVHSRTRKRLPMQQSWAGVADGNAGFGKTGMRQCRVRYVPYMFAHWHPSRMRKLRPLRPTR